MASVIVYISVSSFEIIWCCTAYNLNIQVCYTLGIIGSMNKVWSIFTIFIVISFLTFDLFKCLIEW